MEEIQVPENLEECLEATLRLSKKSIKALKTHQILPLCFSLEENLLDDSELEVNAKIDLVCCIDISGSMYGAKLVNVKKTIEYLLNVLHGGHRLAIVLFHTKAELLMNFKQVNNDTEPRIKTIINSIVDKGSTNITQGMHVSQELLGKRKTKNQVSSIFLLSDGEHNQGPINNEIVFGGAIERTKCEYTTSTFGYGDDHNAEQMQRFAERGGGTYYFVDDVERVDECFVDCIGQITSAVGQNAVCNLSLIPTEICPLITFKKTFGGYWKPVEGDNNNQKRLIKFSTIFSGFKKDLIAEIELGAFQEVQEPTELEIAKVEIKVESLKAGVPPTNMLASLKVRILPKDSEEPIVDVPDVIKHHIRVRGAEVMEVATQFAGQGNYDAGIRLLGAYKKDLEAQDLEKDAVLKEIFETCITQQKMIENDKKGVANKVKSKNFAQQSRNMYMNQCSAPLRSEGLYMNKKKSRMQYDLKTQKKN